MPLYRVKNWGQIYENNRSREIKAASWVPIPNRHDDDAYLGIVDRLNGAAIFGAFVTLLMVASKCNPRGLLMRSNGIPHDAVSLSRMTRLKEAIIAEALDLLVELSILEIIGPQEGAALPQEGAALPHGVVLEQKGTEQKKGTEGTTPVPASRELWKIENDLKAAEKRRNELSNLEQTESVKAKLANARNAVKTFKAEKDAKLASTQN